MRPIVHLNRERARRSNGQFGTQPRTTDVIELGTRDPKPAPADMERARLERLMAGCSNAFGEPLAEQTRERLTAYLRKQDERTWEDVHSIILNERGDTIWQLMTGYYPDPPVYRVVNGAMRQVRGWSEVPTKQQFLDAVRRGGERNRSTGPA